MQYLTIEHYYSFIFQDIYNLKYDDQWNIFYEDYASWISILEWILYKIQNKTYYPRFYDKATYIFLEISIWHHFPNWNKRLALFSFAIFKEINNYKFKSLSKNHYRKRFRKYFPNYKISNFFFNSNIWWWLYNLTKAINIRYDSNPCWHTYEFDELKNITKKFIKMTTLKKQ